MKKLVTLLLPLAMLTGCSQSAEPSDQTLTGALEDGDSIIEDDNSRYDDYQVKAEKGWTIRAELESDEFQPYIWLFSPSRHSLIQQTPLDGTNSIAITHVAEEAGTYTVRANSFDGTGRGAYTLRITAGPGGAGESNSD